MSSTVSAFTKRTCLLAGFVAVSAALLFASSPPPPISKGLAPPTSVIMEPDEKVMGTQKSSSTVPNAIKDIELETIQGPSGSKFVKIGSLWENQTVVIHVLRRFGCRLCRANALELQKVVPILESKDIRVVAVGIEKLGVEEFQQGGYWNGELYIDNGKKMHKALDIKFVGVLGAINMIFANKEVKEAIQKTREVPGNLKGDGRQLGATFIIAKGGETLMDFHQQNFADHPSNDSILKACGLDPSLYIQKDTERTERNAGVCDDKCSV